MHDKLSGRFKMLMIHSEISTMVVFVCFFSAVVGPNGAHRRPVFDAVNLRLEALKLQNGSTFSAFGYLTFLPQGILLHIVQLY